MTLETLGKNGRTIIALSVVYLSFGFLFLLCVKTVPMANRDLLMIAAGAILAALGGVIGYYFGSTKDKSDAEKADRDPSADQGKTN
jgi:hypothetical protein